jgi:hypothetical protein
VQDTLTYIANNDSIQSVVVIIQALILLVHAILTGVKK